MRISDWSSDVCSSDLREQIVPHLFVRLREPLFPFGRARIDRLCRTAIAKIGRRVREIDAVRRHLNAAFPAARIEARSEEHTSELQSLMRISYAVFCLKKKKKTKTNYLRALSASLKYKLVIS